MSAAAAEPPVIPEPVADPWTGQWVWILFWRAHVLPDGRDAGSWDATEVRVVAAGRMVAVDLAGSAPPDESSYRSGLYFAEPGDVYETRDDAYAAAAGRKPPPPPAVPRV